MTFAGTTIAIAVKIALDVLPRVMELVPRGRLDQDRIPSVLVADLREEVGQGSEHAN
eukprot:CAMPEP_0167782990 /NCGR_PEP_ID=MMETSP0111_2-20121227/6825_1 /TAXON_ID=91324 /ORGANISM="Lotharella globosa, Strain CCCM811" /LENGTH=56 /DNA_ID=CAMNT_0007673885 /DNA_START=451 /DNA_END=621 /DNA_ORIENTATION=+